jgi:AcrR family transcriptional regulator
MKVAAGGRGYRMTARAESAAATGERILDAAVALFWERPTDQIVLREVAERAGVTVQTVIRRYGGREGLLAAAAERQFRATEAERAVPVGDAEAAVSALLDHYERNAAGVLRLLAAEESSPMLAEFAERGRGLHREWCRNAFGPSLTHLTGVDHDRRLAQVVAVCDVYTWKLLRLDAGLSRRQTHLAVAELLAPLLTTDGSQ